MDRCFDCFAEFALDAERFAVLKQMRDADEAALKEEPSLKWLLFDPVYVCEDCAGWYGDDAMRVTASEAL